MHIYLINAGGSERGINFDFQNFNNTYTSVNVDDLLQISSVLPLAKNFKNESFLVVHGTGDGELELIFCS